MATLTRRMRGLMGLLAISGVVAAGTLLAPTAAMAAPSGAFTSVSINKAFDGQQFSGNPVDSSPNNDVVAVNDTVGFTLQGVSGSTPVADAVFTMTLPTGWYWDAASVNAALNFTVGNGSSALSGYPLSGTGNTTITATWNVLANAGMTSAIFKAVAGPTVADGSTYTPVVTITDGAGTATRSLPVITVKAKAQADLVISAQGAPTGTPRSYPNISGGAPVSSLHQTYRVELNPAILPPAGSNAVGFSDFQEPVSFTISITGVTGAFEFPRFPGITSNCWSYVSPGPNPNFTSTNTGFTVRMKSTASCINLIRQNNWLTVDVFTPLSQVQAQGCLVNSTATVTPVAWTDAHGNAVEETPITNNSVTVQYSCNSINWGWSANMSLYAPNTASAQYDVFPNATTGWTNVNASNVAKNGSIESSAYYSFDNPSLTNPIGYVFWDATKQVIDLAKPAFLGHGAGVPAATDVPGQIDPNDYVIEYTTGALAAGVNNPSAMTWTADPTTLPANAINGVRFRYTGGAYAGYTFADGSTSKILYTVVPFTMVGSAGQQSTTYSRWGAPEIAQDGVPVTNRGWDRAVTIVGNLLDITKQADVAQVNPLGTIEYTLAPDVRAPAAIFSPVSAPNLSITDTLPIGIASVDLGGLDPAWTATVTPRALGADNVPYTDASETGIVIVFHYTGNATSDTDLPEIVYTATTDILVPPTGTLVNTAVISADDNGEPESARRASESVTETTPSTVMLQKQVIGDTRIQVEDPEIAWSIRWVNYTVSSLGASYFVDELPYPDNDARGDFTGTANLSQVELIGSAAQAGSLLQYTTDDRSTIGTAPANSTNWTAIAPAAIASVSGITAIRVVIPDLQASQDGYGGVNLHFAVSGQHSGDVYGNDASGYVSGTPSTSPFDLGVTNISTIDVVGSTIAGLVWEDINANGVRDSGEPLIPNTTVNLYRPSTGSAPFRTAQTDANGAYLFDELHSDDYSTVDDTTTLPQTLVTTIMNTYDLDGTHDSNSGTVPVGIDQDVEDVDYGYALLDAAISLEKSHVNDILVPAKPGDVITWTFTITNTGETDLHDVQLTDHLAGVSTPVVDWPTAVDAFIPVGGSATATATYTVTQDDIDAGGVPNTASVTGLNPNDVEVTDDANDEVELLTASLVISKFVTEDADSARYIEADDSDGLAGQYVEGQTAKWRIIVTNTGTSTLHDLELSDPEIDDCVATTDELAPGDSITVDCESIAADDLVNTATVTALTERAAAAAGGRSATATPDADGVLTASDTARIVVEHPEEPVGPTVTSSGPKPDAGGGLAITGAELALPVAIALLISAIGALVIATRRRRATDED